MATFTTLQEMAYLATRLENNTATPGDRARFETLVKREIGWRLAGEMPAIQAEARRRHAVRQAAAAAGRRAGLAAGRRMTQQFQSDAHRRAHDAAVAQNNRNRRR